MFAKFLVREWRESLGVVLIALTLMLAMAGLNAAGRQDLILFVMGMFLLFFLPLAGLLLGSAGFQAEFRDNAWIYLFSRPIRKEVVWAFKYVSQLSILLFMIAAFMALKSLLPVLDRVLSEFAIPGTSSLTTGGLPGLSLYLLLPMMAFTLAFSMSLLSDRAFTVFFVALLSGAGFAWIVPRYHLLLFERSFLVTRENLIWVFIAAAFVLASILTFARADFSQPGRRTLFFAKRLAVFLVLAFGLGALLFTEGRILFRAGFTVRESAKTGDGVYFRTWSRGLLQYNGRTGKTRVIDRRARAVTRGGWSLRGETLAYLRPAENGRSLEARLMNADGTGERALPLPADFPNDAFPGSLMLSPDGRRIALLVQSRSEPPALWTMGIDGSGAASVRPAAPAYRTWQPMAWPAGGDRLIYYVENARPPRHWERLLLAIDTRDGSAETLAEGALPYYFWVSPGMDRLAFRDSGNAFRVLDLGKPDARPEIETSALVFNAHWAPDGRRLAVVERAGVRIHDFDTGQNRYLTESGRGPGFDWLPGDGGLALILFDDGRPVLNILDSSLGPRMALPVPARLLPGSHQHVWGLEGVVLVKSYDGPLWRVDLASGAWKRVG